MYGGPAEVGEERMGLDGGVLERWAEEEAVKVVVLEQKLVLH